MMRCNGTLLKLLPVNQECDMMRGLGFADSGCGGSSSARRPARFWGKR